LLQLHFVASIVLFTADLSLPDTVAFASVVVSLPALRRACGFVGIDGLYCASTLPVCGTSRSVDLRLALPCGEWEARRVAFGIAAGGASRSSSLELHNRAL